ncbi:MAG: cysteine desulfurase family protein [Dehalococcoidia bacterium]
MIYLDHAATTKLRADALQAMLPFLGEQFGNPSGLYAVGREAQGAVDSARETVASILGCRPSEMVFTSGGTESINTAIRGIALAMQRAGAGGHVITSAIEHHAGLHAVQYLEERGFEVTEVGSDQAGRVDPAEIAAALRPDTVLVSVMLANNEVGTIQPVAEVAAMVRGFTNEQGHRALLHTDAVQAPGWLRIDVEALGVDALSLSAHKFGGPKGTGILYLRKATPFTPLLHGGGQEMQKRAGTENVAGIAGTAAALEAASLGVEERGRRVRALRERLREGILASVPGAVPNGCQVDCLPNNLNVSFPGVESDVLVGRLDAQGIAVSSGSACSNSTWEPSHVLMAMGVHIRQAVGSIRFSLGEETSGEEIDAVLAVLPGEVELARKASTPALSA